LALAPTDPLPLNPRTTRIDRSHLEGYSRALGSEAEMNPP